MGAMRCPNRASGARLRHIANTGESAAWPTGRFTQADLDVLKQWDTPTICNGLELIVPERRAIGFTVEPMVASTASRCRRSSAWPASASSAPRRPPRGKVTDRASTGTTTSPTPTCRTIAVIQDIDDRPGYGAFWGEVQSTIHKALGALGCVTNGSFRDLDMWAPGFQMIGGRVGPSHAHVHMVDFGQPVNVFGMQVVA